MEKIEAAKQLAELWETNDLRNLDIKTIVESSIDGKGVWLDAGFGHIVAGVGTGLRKNVRELMIKWRIESAYAGAPRVSMFREVGDGGEESDNEDEEGLLKAGSMYAHIYQATEEFYARYKKRNSIDLAELGLIIRDMIDFITTDRRFALRFTDFDQLREDYFITHAVETTILSLVIGKSIKLVPHRLMYLGISSFLHEIGLLHMPPTLLDEDRILNVAEKATLAKHTILGYNILKPMGLEREIMLGVLQHHERSDGSGYTEGVSAESISLFAKIIGVTCSYHAQIFERNFKEAKTGHSSLVDLLNSFTSKYDPTILKVLVQELSIFPLGSGVTLSDGSTGVIMDVDPVDPRHPTARILLNKDGSVASGLDVIRIGGYLHVKNVLNQKELQEVKLKVNGVMK
jgi:HD-GYP domain-containing protein (c-di-GMP phosphodiesterase class II)